MALKVALVHDWLVSQRGGEAVLEGLVSFFPDAPIYSLVVDRSKISTYLSGREIRTSFLQTLPGAGPSGFRRFLPIFPSAVANWDFSDFDLIISTSHCVAKAAGHGHGIPHISYIHSPMRYIWDQWPHYAPRSPVKRGLLEPLRRGLQLWDKATSRRSNLRLIANSNFVAERIRRVWSRDARVVYPPVDTKFFETTVGRAREHWCVLSALVPYKRIELAVVWANAFKHRLVIVGEGPERERLEGIAGPTVSFLGRVDRSEIQDVFSRAHGLIFPGVEDFGIVPLEAMAAGVPVVAFAEGGALETVTVDEAEQTGAFFSRPDAEAIEEAAQEVLTGWEHGRFKREAMLKWVNRFSRETFKCSLRDAIQTEMRSLELGHHVI